MKRKRQTRIIELIRDNVVETQDELLAMLSRDGFVVTQATISRDIKDLHLIKSLGSDGRYRYTTSKTEAPDVSTKFYALLADSAESLEVGQNIMCIKCHVGMAQAICAAMDNIAHDEVIGTIAGDDTIFALCRSNADAEALRERLSKYVP